MLRWKICHRQRPLHLRRSIICPVVIFMITTGFLYTLVEHYTMTSKPKKTSTTFFSKSTSLDWNCELRNETILSINLAPSDHCKTKVKDVSCHIDSIEDFFPKSLPRFCPIKKGSFGDVIGCVSSDNSTHDINKFKISTTNIMCIDYCLKHSVSFAEYNDFTGQCFCLSTFEKPNRLITAKRTCTELFINKDNFQENVTTLYRTGYTDFGNHLEKRRPSPNNTQITIVFFLTVGGRHNLRQIKRLIRVIYSPQHYYLIHIDSRENYLYDQLEILSKDFSNIRLTNKRYPTTWGASTLLLAHLDAFKQIFDEFKWKFSFIINLSESDFPVKPVQVLTNFLSMYKSNNFLSPHNQEPFKFFKSQGMFQTFIHCNNYMYRIGARPLIQNIVYDGGSDWYILNYEFVHYITYGNDELVTGLRHIFNYSLLPCEAFFHIVLSNSIYCDSYIRNNLRFVNWNRERGCKCQHKNVVDWCGCSPLNLRSFDKTALKDTIDKPVFFARKFDPTIDEKIVDWLDGKISRRNLTTGALYLQNLYHSTESIKNLNNVFKLLDLYTRTRLIEYKQYRRHCFRTDIYQLEQIHSIFHLSIFQGYSLQYRFNDGDQFELFIKLNSLAPMRSEQVKRFEVGTNLDIKEIVFTDRSRTFLEPKSIKVLIEWEYMIDNDTSLVITNPNGAVLQRANLLPSLQLAIIDIFFPVTSSSNMTGIWQMSIVQEINGHILGSLDFLVLSSNEEELLNMKTIITNFWSISNMCTITINSSSCLDLFNQTVTKQIPTISNCFEQRWSFFYFDIKSDW